MEVRRWALAVGFYRLRVEVIGPLQRALEVRLWMINLAVTTAPWGNTEVKEDLTEGTEQFLGLMI